MSAQKEDGAKVNRRPSARPTLRQRTPLALAVATKRQTHEEQRQFYAALDGFLAEWVRQHLGPQGQRS